MVEKTDAQLLQEYASCNSEEAFATLVQRHINMVYSVALRQLRDAHKAQDVSQAVFIILARKAASLRNEIILTGWLYQTARHTAANFLRTEIRRQEREHKSFMETTLNDSPAEASWENLVPVLEEAMARLGDVDRNAVLLRFFEGKSVTEVASALGLNEEAAKKRLSRSMEKMRTFVLRRGIVFSTAALVAMIGANSVQAAPAGLASAVTLAAAGTGATAGASTLATSTLNYLSWVKMKAMAVLAAASLLAAGTTYMTVKENRQIGGIGLLLVRDQKTGLYILQRTYANSPAERVGLPAGLFLMKVNGIDIQEMTIEQVPLRGRAGTKVLLEFADPKTGVSSQIELTRTLF
ncbi:MAG: hypothetical protein JWM68_954 [Verrucomicrobiales bacterium]|nr:hypothetical protein [Verrucomicrobiales bacterium]